MPMCDGACNLRESAGSCFFPVAKATPFIQHSVVELSNRFCGSVIGLMNLAASAAMRHSNSPLWTREETCVSFCCFILLAGPSWGWSFWCCTATEVPA